MSEEIKKLVDTIPAETQKELFEELKTKFEKPGEKPKVDPGIVALAKKKNDEALAKTAAKGIYNNR